MICVSVRFRVGRKRKEGKNACKCKARSKWKDPLLGCQSEFPKSPAGDRSDRTAQRHDLGKLGWRCVPCKRVQSSESQFSYLSTESELRAHQEWVGALPVAEPADPQAHAYLFLFLFLWGGLLEFTSTWPPARVEEVPNRSKWLTPGTSSRSEDSVDEFQINETHKK